MAASLAMLSVPSAAEPGDSDNVTTTVNVRLVGQRAQFIADIIDRRGEPHWSGGFAVPLPMRGSIIGGTARANGESHPLTLEGEQASEALLEDASTRAPSAHRLGAVVVSNAQRGPWVEALMPRGGPLSVSLSIEAPTCFVDGDRVVAIPSVWRGHITGAIVVTPAAVAARKLVARCPGSETLVGDEEALWIEFAGAHGDGAHGAAVRGAQFVAANTQIAKVQLEVPEQFSAVPSELHTILLFDRSRSLRDADAANERRLATAYLDGTATHQAQAIVYARVAALASRGWMRGDALAKLVPALTSGELHNGSNLDEALRMAGSLLAALPTKQAGARRIIVFTDGLMAARLAATSPVTLAALLPPGTLVHVADLEGNQYDREFLVRDDTRPLAKFANLTGGVAAYVEAVDDDDKTVVATDASLLVRPHSIDFLRIADRGWSPLDQANSNQCFAASGPLVNLHEGQACEWTATRADGFLPTGKLRIEGQVWGQPWTRLVDFGVAQNVALARDLTAGNSGEEFANKEFTKALWAGAHAVNAEYALVAKWGGQGGYSDESITAISGICSCDSAPPGIGFGNGIGTLQGVSNDAPLRQQFADAFTACNVAGAKIHLTVEMTRDEIVDVAVTVDGGAASLSTCVAEALWNSSPTLSSSPDHAVLSFDY